MSMLYSPLPIRSKYSSNDGFANDWHLVHLGSRAVGGAALVFQEATAVSPEGRISAGDMGLWKDEHIDNLGNIVAFIHRQGSIAGIQLAHAGRKGSTQVPWEGGKQIRMGQGGWQTSAPSGIAYRENDEKPKALSREDISGVIAQFRASAKRARVAGYKVIELHAAHGYLIHQFLSPLSNLRTDEYGGSFENRTRFLLEIVQQVRAEWSAGLPLFVRISASDWAEDGWNENESSKLAAILKTKEVDLIDCSSGGLVPTQQIRPAPGYQVPFAEKIKIETGILTAAVGLITEVHQAESILLEKKADMIMMAREELRNPYFPLIGAAELHEDVSWPVQYTRAKPS